MFRVVVLEIDGTVVQELARPSGKFRHQIKDGEQWPHIGDFVVLDGPPGQRRIEAVLPRRTALVRKNPGEAIEAQVLAANIDTVFIMVSLAQPPNAARLERSLALVWDSGAAPVIVLTKQDVCSHLDAYVRAAEETALGVPVLAVSAVTGDGIESLGAWLMPAQTVALMGPSGVGKSTLLNYWLGDDAQRVMAVRTGDHRGRHTTTHRELFRLPNGALVMDIPGIREVGLWAGSAHTVFGDVEQLAEDCRFTDCRHQGEPGCAVAQAIHEGRLDAERLTQYQKLEREHQFIERKRSQRAQSEARQLWKRRSQEAKAQRMEKRQRQ
nr:ribosome small subunit-dependent GTPase A [Sulfobacillus harzensis]